MKVAFFSNYLTHHQIPFCLEMQQREDIEFFFVSTEEMEEERKCGGWDFTEEYAFEIKAYKSDINKEKALQLAAESDVMIIGSAPEEYVAYRMKEAKNPLTFRYSERIYKGGRWRVLSPRGAINRLKTYFRYLGKPLYMLCASAYTAGDLALLGSYLGKCFKWGYFPKAYTYNIEELIQKKEENTLLWAARMIDWKHPEIPILVAKRLKEKGYQFHLQMIGVGPLLGDMEKRIAEYGLGDCVHLLGAMSPQEVRTHMENSSVFLFTSDQNEGWGAVLNEAMNSGCAVIANGKIGAVPFLLDDGTNGFVYYGNHIEKICQKVEFLLNDKQLAIDVGKKAYETIMDKWCAEKATGRLIETCNKLLEGKKEFFSEGPCSKARIKARKG